jgi:hypothetical protein
MKRNKFVPRTPSQLQEIIKIDKSTHFLNVSIDEVPTFTINYTKDNDNNIQINEEDFIKTVEFINNQLSLKIEKLEKLLERSLEKNHEKPRAQYIGY